MDIDAAEQHQPDRQIRTGPRERRGFLPRGIGKVGADGTMVGQRLCLAKSISGRFVWLLAMGWEIARLSQCSVSVMLCPLSAIHCEGKREGNGSSRATSRRKAGVSPRSSGSSKSSAKRRPA